MADTLLRTLALSSLLAWTGCRNAAGPPPAQPETKPAPQAVTAPAAAPAPATSSNGVEVRTYGALRAIFHQGQTGPQVKLSDITGPDVQAVGALSDSRGEVTIVDGTIWLGYPDGENGARVEKVQQSDEQAMLLVAARNNQWRRVTLEEDIDDASLDAKLEALAAAQGVDVSKPFPMRVEGPIANLKWHVLDGSKAGPQPATSHEDHMKMAASGAVAQADGLLVGFFSKNHHGVFTHMGSNSHFHVVLAKEGITGHVDGITLKKGATLLLPQ